MARLRMPNVVKKYWIPALAFAVLIVSVVIGSYLRLYPVFNSERLGYGPKLYEMDPYSEYWIAKQLEEHGLMYFYKLTKDNPVTKVFWYPWGRDFVRTEPPFLAFFSVITYHLAKIFIPSLSLYDWMVYLPVLFYIITVIAIFFTTRELWGYIPAAVASLSASLVFVSRHLAGFTVKYAIGIPFIFLAMLFHIRTWKKRSLVDALIFGILISVAAASWAGFNLLLGAVAAQIALLPLIKRIDKTDFILTLAEYVPLCLTLSVIPFYGGVHYIYASAGIVMPASLILMLIGYGLQRIASNRNIILTLPLLKRYREIYIGVIAAMLSVGVLLLIKGYIAIKGKALVALGFRSLVPTLVRTVQEYVPASASNFVYYLGALIIVSVPMLAYFAYRAFIKKEPNYLFILALFLLSLVSTANISYFFAYFNYVAAFTASSFVYLLVGNILTKGKEAIKRSWFRSIISISLVCVFVIAIIAQGTTLWARIYRASLPTIVEAATGIGTDAPVWIDGLNWVRAHTNKSAVIVAWWDYGYWISVVGDRPSVADGATINMTQIRLLAEAMTGTEEEAFKIFTKYFKIDPKNLYIAVYEFYQVDPIRGYVYLGPLVFGRTELGADAAKGISAMYRIAEKKPPVMLYVSPYTRLGFILPNWTSPQLQNATLYKILLNTAYILWGKQGYRIADLYVNPRNPVVIPRPHMKIFKPAYIAVSDVFPQYGVYLVLSIYKCDISSLSQLTK